MRAFAGFFTFLVALIIVTPANAQPQLLHQERSLYRNIFVTQNGDLRCMLFRYPHAIGRESCMLVHEPSKLVLIHTQLMMAGLYLDPNPKRVLVIGEGGGAMPAAIQEMFPDARIDVVEIDEAVDKVARDYFDFKPGPKMRVTISDGRVFVKRIAAQKPNFDLVFLDAFESEYIPEHMMTREFFQELRTAMAPDGVIVANTFSYSSLYDYESVTYRDVFGAFFNLKRANRIIVGRVGGILPDDLATAQKNAELLDPELAWRGSGSDLLLPLLSTDVDWNPNTRLLTDQYSPSNLLNAIPRN
jgi:spermidine synthase